MVPYMLSNQKINPIVTELYISGSKLNISLDFTVQYFIFVPKYQTKLFTLFYYQNCKETRTSRNSM